MPYKFNKITPLGIAFPKEDYPKPVLVTRAVLMALYELEQSEAASLEDHVAVMEYFKRAGNDEALDWMRANPDKYNAGLGIGVDAPQGFEVKRYRVALEYEDGTRTILREEENLANIKRYAADVQSGFKQRGFVIVERPDKGVDVGRNIPNAEGGVDFRQFMVFKVSVIKARDYTPIKDQRLPSATDKELQAQAE